MGYLATWKVLEAMIASFKQKDEQIPDEVMSDLKSARTLIQISFAEKGHSETAQKIEEYLASVESYLVNECQKKYGHEHVEAWLDKLNEATKDSSNEECIETRFIAGVPRDQRWVRVKPTKELTMEKLKMIISEMKLSSKFQQDGTLLVYGSGEAIKDFVREMKEIHKQTSGKLHQKVRNC